ncbi:cytochrome P450 [Raphidocelis subcapitata]|uniref:Cytochrome P450 n=1 Tax=Raphidocelis subcapitata TaxID=307507 RepID=A0A2V0PE61_9CHLO|nr:cytochrome P450 [Raphidocelis subcapitata]|eukprot:GBF98134.1 cytochrome P450 [Raphidocelis subcapitata]
MPLPVLVAAAPAQAAALAVVLLPLAVVAAWLLRFAVGVVRFRRLKLPSPPVPSLFLGHAGVLLSETSPVIMAKWVKDHGPLIKLRVLGQTMVVLSDPAAAAKLNRIPGVTKPPLYREFDLPSSRAPSMFSDEGSPFWKAVRVGVAPCFSTTSLKRTFPWLMHLCAAAVEELSEAARAGAEVDVGDLAARITSDTIGDMLLSKDLGGMARHSAAAAAAAAAGGSPAPAAAPLTGPDYIGLVRGYLAALHHRLNDPLYRFRLGAAARRRTADMAAWDTAIDACAREAMAAPPPDYTIAGHLLKVVDPTTGGPLSLQKLKGELSIFYIAGFETTSHAITWTLGLLASHPSAQRRLAEELAAAGLAPTADAPAPRAFEWSDLGRLPFLLAAIRESMRLFQPAAGGSLRALPAETEVLGTKLPAGMWVTEPMYAMGRAPFLYSSPDEFRPERWRAEGGAPPPDPMPFSVGPRDCVGQTLAMLELQAAIATLAGRFEFSLTDEAAALGLGSIAPLQRLVAHHITMFPRGGLKLCVAARAPVEVPAGPAGGAAAKAAGGGGAAAASDVDAARGADQGAA